MRSKGNEEIASFDGISVSGFDFKRLLPGNWLNDEVLQ